MKLLSSCKAIWSIIGTPVRKCYYHFRTSPIIKSYSSVIDSLSFLAVNKTLVCIDDFERKGDDLNIKEILGIVAMLKEQKNCKVVLILNNEILKKADTKNEYQQFREKVIDINLMFNPTAAESTDILAWQNKEDFLYKKLREFAISLKIRNIRILKKIEEMALELNDSLESYEPEILVKALHSLVLLCWSFYTKSEEAPNFEFLKNINNLDKKDESETIKKHRLLLLTYRYLSTDAFDLVIADAVEAGYVDKGRLIEEADKEAAQYQANKLYGTFDEAWKVYRNSFNDNTEEVVNSINNAFKRSYKYLSAINLDQVVKLFRNLDQDKLADELIDFYLEKRKDEVSIFNLGNIPYHKTWDENLKNKFDAFYNALKPKKTLKKILYDIAQHRAWSSEDKETLLEASEQTYYAFFKAEDSEDLRALVEASLLVDIGQAKNALIYIGRETKLNEMRVASYGIKINDNA